MRGLEWSRLRVGLTLVAFGWLLGLVQLGFYAISYRSMGQAVPWPALAWNWLNYGLGALALPWLVGRAWRERFERGRWLRQLPAHLGRALAVVLCVATTYYLMRQLGSLVTGEPYSLIRLVDNMLRGVFLADLYRYVGISIAATAVRTALDLQSKGMEAARLNAELATTRLQLLKAQLDPHFLFNTLNAVSALVRRDPDGAERMISRLSDLLRLLLESGGREEVALAEELDHLDAYVEIQRTRFRDRLVFELDVPVSLMEMAVPNLVLQPLVENAIRHGMLPRRSLRLRLEARTADGRLVLRLEDDGRGLPPGGVAGGREGVGISNTRARLQALYGEHQSFELRDRAEGGAVAVLTLPLRPSERPVDSLTQSRNKEDEDVDAFASDDRRRRAGGPGAAARSLGA